MSACNYFPFAQIPYTERLVLDCNEHVVYEHALAVERGFYRGSLSHVVSRLEGTNFRWAVVRHGSWDQVVYSPGFLNNTPFLKTYEVRLSDGTKRFSGIELCEFGYNARDEAQFLYEVDGLHGFDRGLGEGFVDDSDVVSILVCGNEFGPRENLNRFSVEDLLRG